MDDAKERVNDTKVDDTEVDDTEVHDTKFQRRQKGKEDTTCQLMKAEAWQLPAEELMPDLIIAISKRRSTKENDTTTSANDQEVGRGREA